MIIEVPRLAAAALADPDHGVNAQLAALAGLAFFGADPTPPDVTVTEPSTDDFAALMRDPPEGTGPVVAAMLHKVDNFAPHGMVAHRDGVVRLVVRYDDAGIGEDEASALYRNCGYTMRAILMALAHWLRDADASRRILNGVHVISARDIWIAAPPELSQEASPVTFAAYCELEVEDTAP